MSRQDDVRRAERLALAGHIKHARSILARVPGLTVVEVNGTTPDKRLANRKER